MLKRHFRLPAQIKLRAIHSLPTPYFVMKIGSSSYDYPRFGFVIGKQVDKRAVVRNRTKRIIRSVIEDLFPKLHGGNDVLIIMRRPVNRRNEQIEKSIEEALKTAHMMN